MEEIKKRRFPILEEAIVEDPIEQAEAGYRKIKTEADARAEIQAEARIEARAEARADTAKAIQEGIVSAFEKTGLIRAIEKIAAGSGSSSLEDEQKTCLEISSGYEAAGQAWDEIAGVLQIAYPHGRTSEANSKINQGIEKARERAKECRERSEAWARKALAKNYTSFRID